MNKPTTNAAFIDSQNINLGVQSLGWTLDWRRFRAYLKEKFHVDRAFLFIGRLPQNSRLYASLEQDGFILVFKPVLARKGEYAKGNVDADLVLKAMTEYHEYRKAVVVTCDGDFYSLIEHLQQNDKLEMVLGTSPGRCSALLKRAARERIRYLEPLKEKLELKPRKE